MVTTIAWEKLIAAGIAVMAIIWTNNAFNEWKRRNPKANHHKASDTLHDIKKRNGRGGSNNVGIDPNTGDVFSPETGEHLGNLND